MPRVEVLKDEDDCEKEDAFWHIDGARFDRMQLTTGTRSAHSQTRNGCAHHTGSDDRCDYHAGCNRFTNSGPHRGGNIYSSAHAGADSRHVAQAGAATGG